MINPVPGAPDLTTSEGALDPVGFTMGVVDGFDVGLSFSRGLHGMVRVAGGNRWDLSLSPALFVHTTEENAGAFTRRGGRVTNANLTALASADPFDDPSTLSDVYAGVGVSRYSAWIDADPGRESGAATVPSALAGLRFGWSWGSERRSGARLHGATIGMEAVGTWITQRNDRQDFVPIVRVFFALRAGPGPPG